MLYTPSMGYTLFNVLRSSTNRATRRSIGKRRGRDEGKLANIVHFVRWRVGKGETKI